MHKVLVENFTGDHKILIKNKNITFKIANNHKTIYHKLGFRNHIVSKGLIWDYSMLIPIYQELAEDFERSDLIDLEFYERWLNG